MGSEDKLCVLAAVIKQRKKNEKEENTTQGMGSAYLQRKTVSYSANQTRIYNREQHFKQVV